MVSGELLVSDHVGAYRRSIRPDNRVQPYGNANRDMVPGIEAIDPESVGGGAVLGGEVMGHPVGILPSAKLILHRSSVRKSMSVSG
jgi:hypothetical protein